MKRLGKVILKGLVIVVPVSVTLYVVWRLGAGAEALLSPLLRRLLPPDGPLQYRPGMGVVLGLFLLLLIGLMTYTFIFRKLFERFERILRGIPLVKSLYGSLQDLMDLVSRTQESKGLNQTVVLDVDGIRLLGFVTQPDSEAIPRALTGDADRVAVYFPMSYQIGGYTLFIERTRLQTLDMNIEDGMRYALTAAMSKGRGGIGESREPSQADRDGAAS